jgi:hypothetical protein
VCRKRGTHGTHNPHLQEVFVTDTHDEHLVALPPGSVLAIVTETHVINCTVVNIRERIDTPLAAENLPPHVLGVVVGEVASDHE